MGRIDDLLERKAKADALPPTLRKQYMGTYLEICEGLMACYVDAASACEDFLKAFEAGSGDVDAMTRAFVSLKARITAVK